MSPFLRLAARGVASTGTRGLRLSAAASAAAAGTGSGTGSGSGGSGVVFAAHGDPDRVLAVGAAPAGTGSVRVRMLAAPVHPMDLGVIAGTYPLRPQGLPAVAGAEGVGIVEEADAASGLAEGDVVVPAGAQFGGTWRQTANVDASAVIRIGTGGAVAGKPLEGDDDLVAALSLSAINPVTAKLLVEGSGLNRGDTLLQNAGNGSVGLFVSQVAHRNGIRAVSLIRDGPLMEDASERATRLGLAHLVVPDSVARTHQFAGLLSDLGPVRAAFDGTGEESSVRAMARALAVGGGGNAALTVYGAAAGGRAGVRVPASALIFGGVSVRGFWLAAWARANREEYERLVVQCAEEIARGDLVVNAERRALSAFWVDAWAGVRDPLRTRKQVLMLQH